MEGADWSVSNVSVLCEGKGKARREDSFRVIGKVGEREGGKGKAGKWEEIGGQMGGGRGKDVFL